MSNHAVNLTSELEKISADVQKTFGSLSAEQLNWKPNAESWSVGQCLEHLIITNNAFLPMLEQIARGERKNSFWENYSPLTSFFGNLVVNSLKSDKKKFPAPKMIRPSESAIVPDIIKKFVAQQSEVIQKFEATAHVDWHKVVLTSPFASFITYDLHNGYRVFVEHEKRHFRQAERVLNLKEFPR